MIGRLRMRGGIGSGLCSGGGLFLWRSRRGGGGLRIIMVSKAFLRERER